MSDPDGARSDGSRGDPRRVRSLPVDAPRVVLVAVAVATVLALVVGAGTSTTGFGAYNLDWDGASDLRGVAADAGADPRVTLDAADYGAVEPGGTVAVVLSPDRPYGPDAAARVRAFVRDGGTLVVAEDFGPHGNDLLAAVGADARVDGRLLRDERDSYRSPAMPVAATVSEHALTAGVERVTLNHGTAVRPDGATVLASTSGFAYRDADRDGTPDPGERPGPFPVATVERVGEGRVVVLGDPSVLVNAMLDRPGNRRLATNLLAGERVLFDHSHAERLPPLSVALLALRRSPLAGALVGTACVLAVAGWVRWGDRGDGAPPGQHERSDGVGGRERPPAASGDVSDDRVEADPDALVAYLRERHPDWSAERARRVVEAALDDRRR